jgi:hypothetical protein
MHWVMVSYTIWFNRRHHKVGHLFQGRYKSLLVEGGSYFVGVKPLSASQSGSRKAPRPGQSRRAPGASLRERFNLSWLIVFTYDGTSAGRKELIVERGGARLRI